MAGTGSGQDLSVYQHLHAVLGLYVVIQNLSQSVLKLNSELSAVPIARTFTGASLFYINLGKLPKSLNSIFTSQVKKILPS